MRLVFSIVVATLIGLTVSASPGEEPSKKPSPTVLSDSEEEALIRESVEVKYVGGLKTRNFNLIRSVCLEETKLMNAGDDGKLNVITLERWSKGFDPSKPPFKSLDHSILKIDRVGSAAQVKLLLTVDASKKIVDFLHMLKIDGEWKIAHIIDY